MSSKKCWGFGSPSVFSGGRTDWGFGSKTPAGWSPLSSTDYGYGDKATGYLAVVSLSASQVGLHFPDDGGVIVELVGAWAALGKTFAIKVRNTGSGTLYPTSGGARAAIPGSSQVIVPLLDGKRLRFVLPVLPVGTYDVYIYYPDLLGQTKIITNAFEVWFRHHSREQWTMRGQFPEHWFGAGPRALQTEPVLVSPSTEWPHGILRAWTRATAEECQFFGGKAVTRLTADFAEVGAVAHVETTLGFLNAGTVHFGSKKFHYTGVTATTFTGCTPFRVYDGQLISAGTMVTAIPQSEP